MILLFNQTILYYISITNGWVSHNSSAGSQMARFFYRGRPLALLNIPVMRITPCNLTTHCRHGQANLRQDDGT